MAGFNAFMFFLAVLMFCASLFCLHLYFSVKPWRRYWLDLVVGITNLTISIFIFAELWFVH